MDNACVEYLADAQVDAKMDAALRRLLTTCFRKPQDHVFHHRRYFIEPYPHRWIIRGVEGEPVAHLGVLERRVTAGDVAYRAAGICDVCVHPDYQRRGCARRLLDAAHDWMERNGIVFSILFGNPAVYRSSGYQAVHNLRMADDTGITNTQEEAMVRRFGHTAWPPGEVVLPGRKF